MVIPVCKRVFVCLDCVTGVGVMQFLTSSRVVFRSLIKFVLGRKRRRSSRVQNPIRWLETDQSIQKSVLELFCDQTEHPEIWRSATVVHSHPHWQTRLLIRHERFSRTWLAAACGEVTKVSCPPRPMNLMLEIWFSLKGVGISGTPLLVIMMPLIDENGVVPTETSIVSDEFVPLISKTPELTERSTASKRHLSSDSALRSRCFRRLRLSCLRRRSDFANNG